MSFDEIHDRSHDPMKFTISSPMIDKEMGEIVVANYASL